MTWHVSPDGVTSPHWRVDEKRPEWEKALHATLGVTVMRRDYHTVTGCECEWCVSRRIVRRENDAYRTRRPPRSMPREASEPAIARMREAHAQGLTHGEIAEVLCISKSYTAHLIAGHGNFAVGPTLFERVMAAQWPMPKRTGPTRRGNRVSSVGPIRMLSALNARGFSYLWLSKHMPQGIDPNQLAGYVRGERGGTWMNRETAEDIKVLYDKYSDQDPIVCGVDKRIVSTLRNKHTKSRTPLPHCWDDDTIGDPNTGPEWTGMCGTWQGFNKHCKAHIPMCTPCYRAGLAHKAETARERYAEGYRRPTDVG